MENIGIFWESTHSIEAITEQAYSTMNTEA